MISIIFGKPGKGKTAYLVADAVKYLNGSEESRDLYAGCLAQVQQLNATGAEFALPQSAPVYSNFPITVPCGTRAAAESYYIDGFHLGFENDRVPVMPVLPSSRIYLSEAQRYYNSRRSKDFPDWVSRFFEEHRHFGLNIMLDVQRPGLIDANIRELCSCFVEIQGMTHRLDAVGNIMATDFHVREFEDWKYVDAYFTTGNGVYQDSVVTYIGNVFGCYQSQSYYNQFVPKGGFFLGNHWHSGDAVKDAEISKIMYQQTPPPGFYPERR